jgi:hypothetical protein
MVVLRLSSQPAFTRTLQTRFPEHAAASPDADTEVAVEDTGGAAQIDAPNVDAGKAHKHADRHLAGGRAAPHLRDSSTRSSHRTGER